MIFKNSFSKVTKFVRKSASNVVQKSNDFVEVSRLKVQIDGEEKKKEIIFTSLGKLVYKAYISKIELSEEIKDECAAIFEHDKEIKRIKGQIFQIKKIKKCSNCGNKITIDTYFCPNCGEKQELIINNDSVEFSDSLHDDDTLYRK